jgi:hypothetical protein
MKIIIGTNHLDMLGGTETFVITLVEEFCRLGHSVDILTLRPGIISQYLQKRFGVRINNVHKSPDLIILNHVPVVNMAKKLFPDNNIIQVIHGIKHALEQPVPGVKHIAISQEIQKHLFSNGFDSRVILNPINCKNFDSKTHPNSKIRNILSLSQSDEFNNLLTEACQSLNFNLTIRNKLKNPKFDVSSEILKSDAVVSLGRGSFESMACGRPVLVADAREYQGGLMDGFITSENIERLLYNNCSGRTMRNPVTSLSLTNELSSNTSIIEQGLFNRNFAVQNFDSNLIANNYLRLA